MELQRALMCVHEVPDSEDNADDWASFLSIVVLASPLKGLLRLSKCQRNGALTM
jgi:hypothetical protein